MEAICGVVLFTRFCFGALGNYGFLIHSSDNWCAAFVKLSYEEY